ncbi:hypothetical protein QYG89_13565 [Bacillus sp. B190/17]|uniref:Ferritin-like domain-containing protein n=1 Tax=Bacillus lumedeiriae TaxID=3058829 RepID=A0ABW8IB10_9BACI
MTQEVLTQEEFLREFNDIKEELKAYAEKKAYDFWTREDLTPDEVFVAIEQRVWLEIAYVFFLGKQINDYWKEFDRPTVTSLCKHMWEEAHHYEIICRVLEKHGYTAPTTPPEAHMGWENLHWEALQRDRACAVAVWNCSETSTTTTHDIVIENCRRIGLDDLARCYEQVKKDEAFHARLGDMIVRKYVVTDEHRANAIWGARRLREEMLHYYDTIYAVPEEIS